MAKCHQNRNRKKNILRREKTREAKSIYHRRKQLVRSGWNSFLIPNTYTEPFGGVSL